jgi:hypothetical protein
MNAVRSIRGFTGSAYNGVIARFNENKDHYRDTLCTISGQNARVKAVVVDDKFHILDSEANKFYKPTKHMISQLAQKTKWGSYTLQKLYQSENAKHHQIFKDLVDISFQEDFVDNEMLFRFNDKDDSCRAFLSDRYAVIDNNWVLDKVQKFLPTDCKEAVAKDKSGEDFINFMVVVPSSLTSSDDSDYGGLIKVSNSEIGTHRLNISAGVFRTICSNGAIGWVKDKHESISVVHRGRVDLELLGNHIQSAISKHIEAMPNMINQLLGTKKMAWDGASMTPLFATVAQSYKLSKQEIESVHTAWGVERNETPGYAKTLFGVINSLTRGSQRLGEASWDKLNAIGGELAEYQDADWRGLSTMAKSMTSKKVEEVLGKELIFA